MIRLVLLIGLSLLTACKSTREARQAAEIKMRAERREARGHLRDAVRLISFTLEDVGYKILAQPDVTLAWKRKSVAMQMSAIDGVRDALWLDNPVTGLSDIWTFTLQLQAFAASDEGQEHFAPYQAIVTAATAEMEKGVAEIVQRAIPDHFAAAEKDVEEFAAKNPIHGTLAQSIASPSDRPADKSGGWLGWVPSFNPFVGVGEGLGDSAQAIADVSDTADRFTDVVEFLPQSLSWRLQLFLYDIEGTVGLRNAVDGVNHAADAAEALAKAAEVLPATVRAELQSAFASLDPKLATLSETLRNLKEACDSLDETGTTYAATATKIEGMASQLDTTFKTFNQTFILLAGDPNAPPKPEPVAPGEPGKPFDVLDYATTADSIMQMAAQLEKTLDTFNGLIANRELEGRIAEVGSTTQETLSSVVWSVVLGALTVLMVFFALLLGYRRMIR